MWPFCDPVECQIAEQCLAQGQVLEAARVLLPKKAGGHKVVLELLLKIVPQLVEQARQAFEAGERYTEKEVNARLQRFHPDSATLRRALVDRGLLARQSAGQAYWRADAPVIPAA